MKTLIITAALALLAQGLWAGSNPDGAINGCSLRVEAIYSPQQGWDQDQSYSFPKLMNQYGSGAVEMWQEDWLQHDAVSRSSRGLNLDMNFPVAEQITFSLGAKYEKLTEWHTSYISRKTHMGSTPTDQYTQTASSVWSYESVNYSIRFATTFYFSSFY